MKFTPTVTIALALAAGFAGAAAAQTSTANPQVGSAGHPQSSYAQPRPVSGPAVATPGQTAPGQAAPGSAQQTANEPQASHNAAMPQSQAAAAPMQAGGNPSVQQAQQRLQSAGLYHGPTDGLMDPDTRMAIARFQEQNGMPRTERLDTATLARLNSSEPVGSGSSMPAATPGSQTYTPAPAGAGGNAANQPAR